MARIKKYGTKLNLDRYNTFITDTDPNSLYLKITEFKDVFSGGKNGFVIEGTDFLQNGTEVKIEVTDVNGDPIYSEPGDGLPEYYEGLAKVVSVHVYDDTPIGEGNITILAELKEYTDATGDRIPIPDEWKGIYNLKWKRRFTINKNFPNEDKVRFYFRPTVDIEEIVKPIFNVQVPLITQSGSAIGIPQIPIVGTYLDNYLGGTVYRIRTTDSNWTGSIEGNQITFPSLGYSASVIEVLNDTDLLVKEPYTTRIGNFNAVSPFTQSQFISTFEYFENETIDTSNTLSSFGKFTIRRLGTFVGDIARVKVYRKSRSLLEDFQLIQDIKLESTEILTDYIATSSTDVYYGNFYGTNLYDYWVSGSDNHQIYLNNDKLLNSVRVDYDSSIGGFQEIRTIDEFQFTEGSEYTLQFNLLYTGGASDTSNIKAFISGSSFRQEIVDLPYSRQFQAKQTISQNFIPNSSGDGKLVFQFIGDTTNTIIPSPEWYISQVSLRASQDTSFSPDEITFIQQIPRKLFNETFDFKFEFYDINNNYIPVDVQRTKQFTGGNDISGQITELSLTTNKTAFTFTSGGIADPLIQGDILFRVTRNGYSGSTTWVSSAFDDAGTLLLDSDYVGGQYPGLLTDVDDFSASLSVSNFTGSRTDIKVSSIDYRVDVDGESASTTVFSIRGGGDGQNGKDGITVIPTVESFTLLANSIGNLQTPLNDKTGSVNVLVGTTPISFDSSLPNDTFRYSVSGINVTPLSTNPTVNRYGITAISEDVGSLNLNVEYKNTEGNITTVSRIIGYTKSRINAPQVTLTTTPKPITVSADSSCVQIGTIPMVSVVAVENYTGSIQNRPLTFLTSTSQSLSGTPTYNTGLGTINFGSVTVNTNVNNVVLNVTASFADSEGTLKTIYDTLPITKVPTGPRGCDSCDSGVFYTGCWDLNTCYYHNDIRRDVVSWGNCYWQTNCRELNSCCGYWWQAPAAANERWRSFGCTLQSVATDILFAQDVYANRTVNIGMRGGSPVIALNSDFTNNGANPSIRITSTGYNTNGIFIGYDATVPKVSFKSGGSCLAWDGTNLYATGTINASSINASVTIETPTINSATINTTHLNAVTICASNFCTSNFRGGTICASTLNATTITGNYIVGSCIQGGCIGGNCIFGSYISGTCICGTNIHGGSITATNFNASCITGACISAGCIGGNCIFGSYIFGTCIQGGCIGGNCIFGSYINGSCICGGTIRIGSGTSVFTADTNGIYLGDTTVGSAKFHVCPNGFLKTTNACIVGCIFGSCIATSNWYAGTITIGTSNSAFRADGTNGIWLGHVTPSSAPFWVDLNGNLNATSATISGTITANAVSIGSDFWNTNGNFQLGGANGIKYPVGSPAKVQIGSDVNILGNVTANNVGINQYNCWCQNGVFFVGDNTKGACWNGTNFTVKGDLAVGTDHWCQNGAFRVGGATGISYSGTGKIKLGSDTCVEGEIQSTTGKIGGWTIATNTLTGGGITLNSTTGTVSTGTSTLSTTGISWYGGSGTNKYLKVDDTTSTIAFGCSLFSGNATGAAIEGGFISIGSTGQISITSVGNNTITTSANNSGVYIDANTVFDVDTKVVDLNGTDCNVYNSPKHNFVGIITSFLMNVCINGSLGICGGGTGTATDWIATSDHRLKNNIKRIPYGLCDVMNLKPIHYTMKSDDTNTPRIGFIAQQVKPFIPEVVVGDCMLGINYSVMVSVLTSAIQQQQQQIEQLRNELCCLKMR